MTLTELLQKGGPVVWILAVYSVLGLAIVLDRWIYYLRLRRLPPALDAALAGGHWDSETEKAVAAHKGPEAAVVRAMLDAIRDRIRDIAQVGMRVRMQEVQRMEHGLRTLGILGNTAPLLGLLGTITGMIKAFMVIEQAGGKVDAQALAGGIWEAMITTGVGLAVAIPLLILLHILEGVVERRANAMSQAVSLVLERHTRDQVAPGDANPHHWESIPHAI